MRLPFAGRDEAKWEGMNREVIALMHGGKTGEALALARELYGYSRKAYGRKHERTANAINNLGFILTQEGKFDEAESCLLAGLEISEKLFGKSSREVALVNANLSRLYSRKSEDILALNEPFESFLAREGTETLKTNRAVGEVGKNVQD